MEAAAAAKLILGGAGSGKTAAALAEYRQVLLTGSSHLLWLAPTFAAAQDVREALVQDAGDAFLDPGVTTFARLAEAVIRDAGLRVRTVSALARRRLLGRIIAEAAEAGALRHFGRVAGMPGFLALVEDWIADRHRREPPPNRPTSRSRLSDPRRHDLEELYARYQAHLAAANLVDAETALWTARSALQHSPALSAGLDLVVADGFTDFTVAEAAMLQTLAPRTRKMWITLTGEDPLQRSGPPLPRREGTGEGLATVASESKSVARQRSGIPPLTPPSKGGRFREQFHKTRTTAAQLQEGLGAQTVHLPAKEGPWPALAHLERNLFRDLHAVESPSAATLATVGRIHIVAASGVQAEIEEVARRVKQLLVAGERPGDVVVAFRSTRDAADRIRQVFADFGIPFWLDAPRWLVSAPVVRSVLGVLRLAAEDWPYRRVLAVAGNEAMQLPISAPGSAGGFPAGRQNTGSKSNVSQGTPGQSPGLKGAAPDTADSRAAIELCVRHAQLPSGRKALLEQLTVWAADSNRTAEPTPAVAQLAAAALASLAELLGALPRSATPAKWVRAVDGLVRQLGLLNSSEAESAWGKLAGALDEIERIDAWTGAPEAGLSLAEFADLMATTAEQLPAPEPYDAVGRVRVLSAEAARFTRPRHLLLAGLSEESFAGRRRVELEDGSPDDPRQSLGDAAADEILLFYQVVMRPTERLTLSYAALDAKAQTLVPSPMVAELERCFGDNIIARTVQTLGGERVDAGSPLSRSDLRRSAVRQAMERRRELLADLDPLILNGIEAVASRARRDQFGAFDGIVDSESTRQLLARDFGGDHLWSPSQLETYAECPFKFFGEQALKLAPPPELALASDVQRRGHLLHDALARLYAALTAVGVPPGADAAEAARLLAEQFRAMVDEAASVRPGRGLDAALREIERRQIADWAERLAEQDSAYRAGHQHLDTPLLPTYFEASFGPRSSRNESAADAALSTVEPFALAVPIEGRQERVNFGGQIDRIDVGRVGERTVFNVIDYKSGRTVLDPTKIESGKQLQLALYSMAAAELLLAEHQAAPLSASYWSVGGTGKGGFALGGRGAKPLEFHQVRDGALHAAPGWEGLRQGMIKRIGELIADIRHGQFPVFNSDENCTNYCELRTICRIAQVRSLEKQWPLPQKA